MRANSHSAALWRHGFSAKHNAHQRRMRVEPSPPGNITRVPYLALLLSTRTRHAQHLACGTACTATLSSATFSHPSFRACLAYDQPLWRLCRTPTFSGWDGWAVAGPGPGPSLRASTNRRGRWFPARADATTFLSMKNAFGILPWLLRPYSGADGFCAPTLSTTNAGRARRWVHVRPAAGDGAPHSNAALWEYRRWAHLLATRTPATRPFGAA